MNQLSKKSSEQFKSKRMQWLKWLNGEDRHSVMRQIYQLVWDAAVYRVINTSRQYATKTVDGKYEFNGMLHSWMHRCFVANQIMAIRRLVDKETSEGEREVLSLWRLIEDMNQNRSLFTRANIFAAEDLEYDIKEIDRKFSEYAAQQKSEFISFPNELCSLLSQQRHKAIDKFSDVQECDRSPDDKIRTECFLALKNALGSTSEDILTYGNKFIAHAASPGSRECVDADELKLTLNHLWNAHRVICQIANFISVHVLGAASHAFLKVPQYNNLRYIDRPLVTTENIHYVDEVWKEYDKETHEWANWGLDGFKAMMKNG